MSIITVSGAACTGKTTILENMKDILERSGDREVHVYSEFIRTVYEEKYKSKYATFADLLAGDPMDIIQIHKDTARQFNEIIWKADDVPYDVYLFDRNPIDIGIYLYMNVADYLDDVFVWIEYRKAARYIRKCINCFMENRPLMFYAKPFSVEVEHDGFRPQSLIDKRSLELALFDKEFYSLPGVEVLPNDLQDRIDYLEDLFEEKKGIQIS